MRVNSPGKLCRSGILLVKDEEKSRKDNRRRRWWVSVAALCPATVESVAHSTILSLIVFSRRRDKLESWRRYALVSQPIYEVAINSARGELSEVMWCHWTKALTPPGAESDAPKCSNPSPSWGLALNLSSCLFSPPLEKLISSWALRGSKFCLLLSVGNSSK